MGKSKDFETKLAVQELAYQVSQGLSLEKAASVCNLDLEYATQIASTGEFDDRLKTLNPEYYEIWAESQRDEATEASVRSEARNDGKKYYKAMKDLVLGKDSLPPKEKALILEKLLRLGGYFRDEEIREVVTLAPGHVQTIKEASMESNMSPDEWPLPMESTTH